MIHKNKLHKSSEVLLKGVSWFIELLIEYWWINCLLMMTFAKFLCNQAGLAAISFDI